MPKTIKTPMKGMNSYPKKSPGTYDGEPGYPKRTTSKDSLPEKTYDKSGPLGPGKKIANY